MNMAEQQPWYAGTWTLVGVIVGALMGFALDQPPIGVVIGLAVGVGLDTWLQRHRAR